MQSPSGSGSLPSNTIANPRGDLKVITTRSGISYDGPTIPPTSSPLLKEVKRELVATKDKVQTTSSGTTTHVQPPVVQIPILEPDVAPKPNFKPLIPYPSRLNDQQIREKSNNQMLKFLKNFQRLYFDLSFEDALLYMPKFASTFKSLLKLEECLAYADLGASINLMPLSLWKKLSLPKLTPTYMTLELANRSVAYSVGVAEDVFVKVRKFHFLADFVVVHYDVDPRVPLILRRPFLRTAQDLIDVYEIEACLTSDSIPSRIDDAIFDPKGDILLLDKLLNDDPSSLLPPKGPYFEELKTIKSSIGDPPELELKELLSHLEYAFLEGTNKLTVIIAKELKDEEKAALLKVQKSHKLSITWKISDIKC
uniref:Reverse transcriptase domain-containing protein n=1 Tax=Tanacetum cinerariifolium TaxID=118510 RepID=A0A699IN86_TANCI|nr:reverse transcriptase domain-containing protein [Tanacetum cinerariifolium]